MRAYINGKEVTIKLRGKYIRCYLKIADKQNEFITADNKKLVTADNRRFIVREALNGGLSK